MYCPYCQTPTTEEEASCRECSFDINGGDKLFGNPPEITGSLTDLANVLSPADSRATLSAIADLESAFPQVRYHLVTIPLPQDTPLATYATWLLNRSKICRPSERGGLNRVLLTVLDTTSGKATIQPGYGLEPILAHPQIERILQGATPAFQGGYGPGSLALVQQTGEVLTTIWQSLEKTFGIDMEQVQKEEIARRSTGAPLQAPKKTIDY